MLSVILLLIFPFSLLALMLGMERVERPLRADALGDHVTSALTTARADEVEHLVTERVAPSVERYWRHTARSARARRGTLLRRPVKQA
jgi:hypothetical protein